MILTKVNLLFLSKFVRVRSAYILFYYGTIFQTDHISVRRRIDVNKSEMTNVFSYMSVFLYVYVDKDIDVTKELAKKTASKTNNRSNTIFF